MLYYPNIIHQVGHFLMTTSYEKIINNEVNVAEFNGLAISTEFITQIAQSLESNISVQTISFDCSHLHDKQLKILAESLIRFGRKRETLILDNTEITKDSVPVLESLIISKVIGSLFLYATEDISESSEIKTKLQKLAADNKVNISFASQLQLQRQMHGIHKYEEKSNDVETDIIEVKDERKYLGKS
jgi:hypothetical protein